MTETHQKALPEPIPLENRACSGIRAYIDQRVAASYPFQIELEYHYVRQQFMITLYEYDPTHPCYAQRYTTALKKHHTVFRATAAACLDYAAIYLSKQYQRPITFGPVPLGSHPRQNDREFIDSQLHCSPQTGRSP